MSVCVLIHGFTGSPHEVEPLAKHLHALGYEVHTPTLAGHASSRADMRQATWRQWIESAESVVKELVERDGSIHIAGFSMGGLIAAHLATKYKVRSLIILSAPVYYVNKRQMVRTFTKTLRQKLHSRHTSTTGEARPQFTSGEAALRYSVKIRITPLRSVFHFRRLVAELKPGLRYVTVPTLIIQGMQDDLVQPRSAQYIYDTIKSVHKQVHYFEESGHMICLGSDQAEINRLAAQFIRNADSEVEA